jgi:hypothetical protein
MPKSNEFRFFHEAAWDVWDQRPGAVDRLVGPDPDDYWRHYWAGLFPNLPALYGRALALEDDIDQTSLKTTDDLRELLKSVRRRGDIVGEATLLKLSNARWRFRFAGELVTIDETPAHPRYAFADSIVPAASAGEMQVNLDQAAGDAKVAFTAAASFTPSPGAVTDVEERDNSVRLTTRNQGRGLLLIAVTAHKYWRATIDGRPAPLLPANVAYQALDVPAGTHTIDLRYRNPLVPLGAIVSLLALLGLAASSIGARQRGRGTTSESAR